jgi:hypothetical protein
MEHHGPINYKAARGGHAPDYVRKPFDEWADAGMESETVEYDGQPVPYKKLLGMLWNCTDAMPGETCAALDLPHGSTYARGVRAARKAKR